MDGGNTTSTCQQALAEVQHQGWALVQDYVASDELLQLRQETQTLLDTPGALPDSQYYFHRQSDGPPRLARVEQVAEAVLPKALRVRMQHDADVFFGGRSRLFKDKLNIRHPESKGYAPHQDAARWDAFGDRFLSFGIFMSDSSPRNGGFEFATGALQRRRMEGHGSDLNIANYERLHRVPIHARSGDVLLVDGELHRQHEHAHADAHRHIEPEQVPAHGPRSRYHEFGRWRPRRVQDSSGAGDAHLGAQTASTLNRDNELVIIYQIS